MLASYVSWEQSSETEGALILTQMPTMENIGTYYISVTLEAPELSMERKFIMDFEVLSPEEAEEREEE